MRIDDTDRRIIGLLQGDARQPNATIARALGVSEATIRRRIKMMVDQGSLTIRAVPNPSSFGLNTSAVIGIDVQPDALDGVASGLTAREEVIFVGVSTGRYDLIVKSVMTKLVGVRKTETLVLLDVKKRTFGRVT